MKLNRISNDLLLFWTIMPNYLFSSISNGFIYLLGFGGGIEIEILPWKFVTQETILNEGVHYSYLFYCNNKSHSNQNRLHEIPASRSNFKWDENEASVV